VKNICKNVVMCKMEYTLRALLDGLFNNILSNLGYVQSEGGITMEGEMERTWLDVIMTYFKLLSKHERF
jgi:hypothetical protein